MTIKKVLKRIQSKICDIRLGVVECLVPRQSIGASLKMMPRGAGCIILALDFPAAVLIPGPFKYHFLQNLYIDNRESQKEMEVLDFLV